MLGNSSKTLPENQKTCLMHAICLFVFIHVILYHLHCSLSTLHILFWFSDLFFSDHLDLNNTGIVFFCKISNPNVFFSLPDLGLINSFICRQKVQLQNCSSPEKFLLTVRSVPESYSSAATKSPTKISFPILQALVHESLSVLQYPSQNA